MVLLGALVLDTSMGEPPNALHPVAWLGRAIAQLERHAPRSPAARLAYGALLTLTATTGSAAIGWLLERATARSSPLVRLMLLAAALKVSFSARELACAADHVGRYLTRGELERARLAVRALVSRPAESLTAEALASAAVESVAENLCDSVVAPLLAYLMLGLPGAFAYRALNTLDAMIGYHGEYEDLGKVAARLDDCANLVPARISAALLIGAAALGFGDGGCAVAVLRRDHLLTDSPNAGWPMSAAAGALRVRLEKRGHYRLGAELDPPGAQHVARAIRLYAAAVALGVGAALAPAVAGWLRVRRRTGWE